MAHFQIINGPSKWNFILSLSDGGFASRRKVTFSIKAPQSTPDNASLLNIDCVLNGLKRTDEDDENWSFIGYCIFDNSEHVPCQGFFSNLTRTGWVEF